MKSIKSSTVAFVKKSAKPCSSGIVLYIKPAKTEGEHCLYNNKKPSNLARCSLFNSVSASFTIALPSSNNLGNNWYLLDNCSILISWFINIYNLLYIS